MRVLDLFSGVGGFSLGLERTQGFTTAAFCEIDPFARRVLAKHWPEVPCYDDVRTLTAARLAADGVSVDVICGGFPCQDISVAGAGAGLDGERSGLWFEYLRLIGEIRPRWVIAENSPLLRSRGLDQVLRGLNAIGYDAEWHCIPASTVGAPHQRDRVWIIANPQGHGWAEGRPGGLADCLARVSNPPCWDAQGPVTHFEKRFNEPALCRVDDGLPDALDRLFVLGNSLHPAIPEAIGHAILAQQMQVAA